GRGGWLRLPGPLLREAGIGSHAEARTAAEGLVLRADGDGHGAAEPAVQAPPAPPAAEPVAELRAVEKRYGGRAVLSRLDAGFRPGRLTLVVGRSGSGKTTLLNLLAGLARPTGGEVLVLGAALAGRARSELAALRRERIGVVGQEPGLVPFLSAEENVALALSLHGGE